MRTFYLISVWLHILAAAIWIGSMVFVAAVLVPVLRHRDFTQVRARLLQRSGRGFRWLGWSVLATLLVTGLVNLAYRGYSWSALWSMAPWSNTWGRIMGWKLGFVSVLLLVNVFHDALVGPRAAGLLEARPASAEALRARKLAAWLGRLELLLSLIILALAVMLVRGPL